MSERRERRYTLHLASGQILDAEGDPTELPNTVEEIPPENWTYLGELDTFSGPDYSRASRWRPLEERRRW